MWTIASPTRCVSSTRSVPAGPMRVAAIADLPAALGVERGAVKHDERAAVVGRRDAKDGQCLGIGLVRIADELAAEPAERVRQADPAARGATRPLALLGHRGLEAGAVDGHARLAGHLDGQVDRKAERVVEPERVLTADLAASLDELSEARAPRLQGAGELRLLAGDLCEDPLPLDGEPRIGGGHQVDHHRAGLAQEWLGDAHQPSVPHSPTHDPAQDVAGAVVRGLDPLGDEEGHRAGVVRDHLVAEPLGLDGLRIVPDERGEPLDDRHEQVGPVVGVHALERRGQALQPHPGVDALEAAAASACRRRHGRTP